MLAIGGMTVSELKARMSLDELSQWVLYAEEMGPLNPMIRMDAAFARSLMPFLVKATMRDLMPWPKEEEHVATLDDFMKILRPAKKVVADGNP